MAVIYHVQIICSTVKISDVVTPCQNCTHSPNPPSPISYNNLLLLLCGLNPQFSDLGL
jgi:hypothetical protein